MNNEIIILLIVMFTVIITGFAFIAFGMYMEKRKKKSH
jgi:hypothetical protein